MYTYEVEEIHRPKDSEYVFVEVNILYNDAYVGSTTQPFLKNLKLNTEELTDIATRQAETLLFSLGVVEYE